MDGWDVISKPKLKIEYDDDYVLINIDIKKSGFVLSHINEIDNSAIEKVSNPENIIKLYYEKEVYIELKPFIEDILNSYNFDYDECVKQFKIDIPRCNYYIDGLLMNDPTYALKIINKNQDLPEYIKTLLIPLSTQAICAVPFKILFNIYTSEYVLNDKIVNLIMDEYYLIDDNKVRMDIFVDTTKRKMVIKNRFKLMQINGEYSKCVLKIYLEIIIMFEQPHLKMIFIDR